MRKPSGVDISKDMGGRADSTGPRGLWVAVGTGFLASICCVGPLVLGVAGVGGAWVVELTALDPARPWLTALSVGLLGFAHIRYWRARRRASCGCGVRSAPRALWLWLGTALVAVALAAPYVLPALIMSSIPTTP